MKKPILSDHIKQGKKFIPPLLKAFENFTTISWEDVTVPEIIWISFIQHNLGRDIGTEFLVEICKNITISDPDLQGHSLGMMSNYDLLTQHDKEKTLSNLEKAGLLGELQFSIKQFLELYPESPINFINSDVVQTSTENIILLKKILSELYDKNSQTSVFTAANVIYNQIISGSLKFNSTSLFTQFPKLQDYPNTDLSIQIAGLVRASIKNLHFPFCFNSNSNWNKYFWQTTYNLDQCKI